MTQPYSDNTLLDDLHPARFLKVNDLTNRWKVQQLTVTIARVTKEETIPNPKDLDPATADRANPNGKPRVLLQPVIYFKTKNGETFPRGYLVSAQADVESIKAATGANTIGELVGKKIIIFVGEHRKKAVLRISPAAPEE